MSEKQLVQAVAEVAGILRSTGQPVDVLACDTAVDVSRKVMRVSAIKLTGGGGTDMSYGIKMAAEVKPRANLIIVLTDCLTGWPEAAPKGTKVVVCALGADDNSIKQIPAWASTVRVKL
jgi:predicted metal-dependent peptidase